MKENNGLWGKHESSFHQMLYADTLRGEDSTGLIGVERDTTFHIMKDASEAVFFLQQWWGSQIQKDMYKAGKAYIGHNRKKTVGAVSDKTAHPFVVGDTFAMVHNGTLLNHTALANTEVDSHALAMVLHEALQKEDRVDALGKTLSKVRGAYAVAAYDQTQNQVMLVRNSERPLGIIETDDMWVFASEPLMAQWILARNGYMATKMKFVEIPEHEAFMFDLDKSKLLRHKLEVKKAVVPVYTPTTNTGTPKTIGGTAKFIEEKAMKFFRRKYLGKRVTFNADDLIEEHYPKTLESGETELMLFGRADNEIEYVHSINVVVDLAEHKDNFIGKITSEKVFAQLWSCIITDIIRQPNGALTIYGDQAKVAKPSLNVKDLNEAREFRFSMRRLTTEELHTYAEMYKHTPSNWKLGAITAELIFRNQFKSLEDAIAKAKNEGVILKQEIVNGNIVYCDDEGNIYYESSVAVH